MQIDKKHLFKMYDVINSCTNEDQLTVAEDWIRRYLFMIDPSLSYSKDTYIHGVWQTMCGLIQNRSNKFKT